MQKKVKVAVFGKDQRVTIKKVPLSDDGTKLKITSGGKNHFMPDFDNNSYLEWPKLGGTEKIYFVRNLARKCVSFESKVQIVEEIDRETGKPILKEAMNPEISVYGFDPEIVLEIARNEIGRNLGKDEKVQTPIILIVLFLLNLIMFLKIIGVFV